MRYVYSPKHRVLYDIINKGQNFTLPVVSVVINSISRDASRVSNAIDGLVLPRNNTYENKFSQQIGTPIPVNIQVNMSIATAYQQDMDQILSNFVAYTNPFIVITWKLPEAFRLTYNYEIRTVVDWSGEISLDYPQELTYKDNNVITASTDFTIKGYIFPEAPAEPMNNIFFIDANFYEASYLSGGPTTRAYTKYDDYLSLREQNYTGNTETVSISAAPQITDIYYASGQGIGERIESEFTINNFNSGGSITLFGKMFDFTDYIALSSNVNSFYAGLTSFNFAHYPDLSCYVLSGFRAVNKNTVTFDLPPLTSSGAFTIIAINAAGFSTSYDVSQSVLVNQL